MAKKKDEPGFSVGKRTREPHAKDGWNPKREKEGFIEGLTRGLRGFGRKRGKR